MTVLVGGLDYWQIKQRAMNGGRGSLSVEQLTFVGFEHECHVEPGTERARWTQPMTPLVDEQLEELARDRDRAPGWYRLALRILDDEGDES